MSQLQRWFDVYAQCQDALHSGDSLEIESAKSSYQQMVEDIGPPPLDRSEFGIFPDCCPPEATGASPVDADSAGPLRVGEFLGEAGGVFGLLYRIRRREGAAGPSGAPPQGVSGTYR